MPSINLWVIWRNINNGPSCISAGRFFNIYCQRVMIFFRKCCTTFFPLWVRMIWVTRLSFLSARRLIYPPFSKRSTIPEIVGAETCISFPNFPKLHVPFSSIVTRAKTWEGGTGIGWKTYGYICLKKVGRICDISLAIWAVFFILRVHDLWSANKVCHHLA